MITVAVVSHPEVFDTPSNEERLTSSEVSGDFEVYRFPSSHLGILVLHRILQAMSSDILLVFRRPLPPLSPFLSRS